MGHHFNCYPQSLSHEPVLYLGWGGVGSRRQLASQPRIWWFQRSTWTRFDKKQLYHLLSSSLVVSALHTSARHHKSRQGTPSFTVTYFLSQLQAQSCPCSRTSSFLWSLKPVFNTARSLSSGQLSLQPQRGPRCALLSGSGAACPRQLEMQEQV